MRKIITFYNNKGGVSKTTTSFNLGAYLSSVEGKKILLIDADPQCNLTELFYASREDLAEPGSALPGTSIYEALRPRFHGDAGRLDAGGVHLIENSIYSGLWILRGDFELGMAESYFAQSTTQAITENVNEKQTYLVLNRLFSDLVKIHKFDHVLVDVGPSVGALTRLAVLSCDAFFMPTTPDRFCNQAISVLGNVLADWERRHGLIMGTFPGFGLEVFDGAPEFLGAVSQNFKTWAGRTKQSYRHWQDLIGRTIISDFLSHSEIPVRTGVKDNPFVAEIRDVGPVAPVAQMFGRAVFDVQQEHTVEASGNGQQYYGAVWENWEGRMSEYRDEMAKLSRVLEG